MAGGHFTSPAKKFHRARSTTRAISRTARRARSTRALPEQGTGALLACIEQVVGIEPERLWCGTPACHLNTSPAWRSRSRPILRNTSASSDAVDVPLVPPPGVEPGLLGFQPSAQTVALEREVMPRVVRRWERRHARRCFIGCLARHPSSLLFGCQRAPAVRRAHLGRSRARRLGERTSHAL